MMFHRIINWFGDERNDGTFLPTNLTPDHPRRDFLPDTRRAILADAVVEMHRAAAEAWRNGQREPIPFDPARMGRETARIISAGQRQTSILVIDNLPLMSNPYAPDYRWCRAASEQIRAGWDALALPDKMRLHKLCRDFPERVCLSLAVWYPQRDYQWARVPATQVLPPLAGVAVNTLCPMPGLPIDCITSVDPDFTEFVPAVGAPCWRLEVYEADAPDELGSAA